jgi:rubrerythrin
MAGTGKEITGTRDTVYDLVSIIYHALQGAETYGMYVADAEEVGDTELAKFFQDVRDEERRRANRAKQLLAGRLGK